MFHLFEHISDSFEFSNQSEHQMIEYLNTIKSKGHYKDIFLNQMAMPLREQFIAYFMSSCAKHASKIAGPLHDC